MRLKIGHCGQSGREASPLSPTVPWADSHPTVSEFDYSGMCGKWLRVIGRPPAESFDEPLDRLRVFKMLDRSGIGAG